MMVHFRKPVKHFSSFLPRHPFSIIEIEYRILPIAQLYPLMYGAQKAVTPKLGIHSLAVASSLGEQHSIGREVFVFTSQAIAKPGPHGRAVSLLDAGLEKSKGRIMVNGLGMHGFDDADVINYF